MSNKITEEIHTPCSLLQISEIKSTSQIIYKLKIQLWSVMHANKIHTFRLIHANAIFYLGISLQAKKWLLQVNYKSTNVTESTVERKQNGDIHRILVTSMTYYK